MSPQPLQWFRLYAEAIDDEKLRLLAFEDRWHYVALLCCKAMGLLDAGDPDGLLHRKLAVKMGLQLRELEAAAQRLAEVGLVDPVTFQPVKWDDRQFKSDTSTERVRAYRERVKRVGNVSETAQETETEIKQQQKQEQASPRGSRLPAGSTLPADWLEWARTERPELDVNLEAAKFADYWHSQAGAKGRKADWKATWRNWIRNSHAPRAGPAGGQQVGKTMQGIMALEGLKRGNRMAAGPDRRGDAEALLPGPRKDSGG